MTAPLDAAPHGSSPAKWADLARTADGEARAHVALRGYETLWFNTGTLCNITCAHCYIESSPTNDRLAYLTPDDLAPFLDELDQIGARACEIAFTGGEPFLNPHMLDLADMALARGRGVLILTNAMRPMRRPKVERGLLDLRARHGDQLALRVSLDHHAATAHDEERGAGAFDAAVDGLVWLARSGFPVSVAGRAALTEDEAAARAGFQRLFDRHAVPINARDPADLILFPEMDPAREVPEITTACWSLVGQDPGAMMCASSRMVVKRKGADRPVVLSCTLLPYDERFELGASLGEASRAVPLAHPYCAQFCVLGGASCSG
ncbi:MAG: radical SAM protein [Caulobacterales bacterium]|nr:radical SAM protein [Caulobacterales bacterium]